MTNCNHDWEFPRPDHPDYATATLVCVCGATYSIGDQPRITEPDPAG